MDAITKGDPLSWAIFSGCDRYRYALCRAWDGDKPALIFIGLNPSTATHEKDDPTIRKCCKWAKEWGFGSYVMLNAWAFRSTDPKKMLSQDDPNGPENDDYILSLTQNAKPDGGDHIIACWGANITPEREEELKVLLQGRAVFALHVTKGGNPGHPLYLRNDTKPSIFWEA